MARGRGGDYWSDSVRGAVLVHVAVAIIGLLAFCALTIDYGVMWVSRAQAQNAADAAALAGAVSLAFDNGTDFDRARMMAKKVGEANKVFGGTLSITQGSGTGGNSTDDISFMGPTFTNQCPPGFAASGDTCIRVNVYRKAGNNPLPVFFAPLFGRTQQGVQATATAVIAGGNATNCMRPFGLMDKWDEAIDSEWETVNGFPDPYGRATNWDPDYWVPLPGRNNGEPDVMPEYLSTTARYVAPTSSSAGTSYRLYATNSTSFCCDYGKRLHINICNPADTSHYGGCYQPLACSGPQCLETTVAGCDGVLRTVGDSINVSQEGLGARIQIQNGLTTLIAQDPTATWLPPGSAQCADGCVYSSATGLVNSSPRIVPVPVFDPTGFANATGSMQMPIRNLIGFFVEGTDPPNGNSPTQQIIGRLVPAPGMINTGGGQVVSTASFLKTVILVR